MCSIEPGLFDRPDKLLVVQGSPRRLFYFREKEGDMPTIEFDDVLARVLEKIREMAGPTCDALSLSYSQIASLTGLPAPLSHRAVVALREARVVAVSPTSHPRDYERVRTIWLQRPYSNPNGNVAAWARQVAEDYIGYIQNSRYGEETWIVKNTCGDEHKKSKCTQEAAREEKEEKEQAIAARVIAINRRTECASHAAP